MAPRMILAAVLSVLALLTAPALASATTEVHAQAVAGVGNVVFVTDDGSSGVIDVEHGITTPTPPPGNVRYVAVRNLAGVQAGTGCGVDDPTNPTIVACEGVFAAVVVYGQGGNDKVTMDLIVNDLPLDALAYGGSGDDELRATPDNRDVPQPETYIEGEGGNDTIVSGNGADELHGGDGNDTMQAFSGADVVRGEAGDDSVSGGKEEPAANKADVVDGGPGFDRIPDVDADYNRGFDDNVSVTMDGQPNDGEPGEGDNVVSVEKLRVVADNATVVGTEDADDIFIEAYSTSTMRGLGGNDRLIAYDANDTIEGGPGNDFLEGGFGNDVLDGGAGVDQFNGDRTESNVFAVGNDQIRARDGNSEQVSCGLGSDTAEVDAGDVVDASCESVDRGPNHQFFGPKTLVKLQLAVGRIPAAGPVAIRVVNANAFKITGALSGQTTKAVAVARKKRVKLKTKSFSVAANSRRTVKLKLPASLRRVLKRTGKLSLTLSARVKDPAGNSRSVKKKVTAKLKR